jgi:hypothetical protein
MQELFIVEGNSFRGETVRNGMTVGKPWTEQDRARLKVIQESGEEVGLGSYEISQIAGVILGRSSRSCQKELTIKLKGRPLYPEDLQKMFNSIKK